MCIRVFVFMKTDVCGRMHEQPVTVWGSNTFGVFISSSQNTEGLKLLFFQGQIFVLRYKLNK
jgi:hypothetical protein